METKKSPNSFLDSILEIWKLERTATIRLFRLQSTRRIREELDFLSLCDKPEEKLSFLIEEARAVLEKLDKAILE